jgi:hypothetical protein
MAMAAKKRKKHRLKYYVGHKGGKATIFGAHETPTEETHGHLYNAVTGPLSSKLAAEFLAEGGPNNPSMFTVTQANRAAKRHRDIRRSQSELAAGYMAHLDREIARKRNES